MKVPLLDLKAQYAPLRASIESAIKAICDSQQFVLGGEVEALEAAVALYSKTRFGIGVSSGTDALLLALMALDIGPGDEVVTTPYTFFATAGTVARIGARPIFCDIDPETFNISSAAVAEFVGGACELRDGQLFNLETGGRVRALMPVHLYGQMADMDALLPLARDNGLAVIEDAAQAIGAELADGRRAGSLGDVGCFSFFPTKNLGAFGDAGMCVANDADIAARLRIMRVHGGEPKYYHSVIGGNFRLDALQAAVLNIKLAHLDDWTAGRQANAARYDRLIADAGLDEFIVPPRVKPGRHIFNQYVIRCVRRNELRAWLQSGDIGTEIYYPLSLHSQQCFAYLGHAADAFPESTRAAAETLALPVYPELTEDQQAYVVERIRDFYRS